VRRARPHAGRCWAAVQWRRRSGPRRGCRHRGAVLGGRAPPGAVTRARSGRPGGGRRWRGCPDAGQAGRCRVRLVRSAAGMSVGPTGRADVQRPGVRGIQVSGRTGLWCARRCRRAIRAALDLEWLGAAGRPGWAQRVDVPPWSTDGVVACPHRAGRQGMDAAVAGAWLARGSSVARAAAWPASRLPRRLGPSGPTWALVQGQGAGRVAGGHGTEQVLTGPRRASWAGRRPGADHGPGPGGGDHAGWSLAVVVSWRSAPEGPLGSVGEQPAAVARPRRVRRAVR
jgi:hypothetical protein